jgi:TRAP-type C4-dicarboxylate transport system substrate-binding protein
MAETYKKAGVEVTTMTPEQAEAWHKLAQESSYKTFAEEVEGGKELLELAQSVE